MAARTLNTTYSENNIQNKTCEYLGNDFPILTDKKENILIKMEK